MLKKTKRISFKKLLKKLTTIYFKSLKNLYKTKQNLKIMLIHPNRFGAHKLNLANSSELMLVRLLFTFSLSFMATIWAIYMKTFALTDSQIGYLNAILLIVSLIFAFFCVNILEKYSNYNAFVFSSIIIIINLIILGITQNFLIFLVFATSLTLLRIIRQNSFNILFRDNINDKELNEKEALLSVIANLGWFIGPVLASFIFNEFGFSTIFYTSAIFSLLALIAFIKIPLEEKKTKKINKLAKLPLKTILKNFINKKSVRLPYLMSMGVSFWWSFIFIYVPLYIIEKGIEPQIVGLFLGLSQLPLIFFEYMAGKEATLRGFKINFLLGYLSLGVIAIACYFIQDFTIILGLLVFASVAMSFLEPLRFPYVFSKLKKEEEAKIIPIFATSMGFGSLLSKIFFATLLLYFTSDETFLFLGISMLLFAIIALKIKN